ncbi:MAG: hypothetical protein EXR21_08920 [Flavobacteriaceae bacterium]|nr:hypothetical protein [Flavobacteriaceae bacterium]
MKKFIYSLLFSIAFLGVNAQSNTSQQTGKSTTPFTVFMPNAFLPMSSQMRVNNFWAELADGSSYKAFEMTIFNRWGEQLFTSTSPEQQKGWDGKYLGNYVAEDTYVAQVKIQAQDGKWYFYNNAVQVVL